MALVFWSSPGVRNPQAMDWYGPWSLKNQVEWQEVSSGWVSKTSLLFTAAPHHPQMGPSCHRKTSSGLLVILHDGELYNYFIIYHNTVIIRIKCTMNAMRLNHPETICPPGSTDKLSFTKLVPGAKKVGDCWSSLSLDWFSSEKKSCHFFGSYISSAAGLVSFRTFYVWLEWGMSALEELWGTQVSILNSVSLAPHLTGTIFQIRSNCDVSLPQAARRVVGASYQWKGVLRTGFPWEHREGGPQTQLSRWSERILHEGGGNHSSGFEELALGALLRPSQAWWVAGWPA